MKKKINILLLLCAANIAFAQIAIGKPTLTTIPSTTNPNLSISLEFGDYVAGTRRGKGIVLPWVDSASGTTGSVPGTIIYDTTDKIIKFRIATAQAPTDWVSLSKNETTQVGSNNTFNTTGVVNTTLQNSPLNDISTAKVSIGTPATPVVAGVLVLESATQAMILPKVPNPHDNIVNPEPGTMVYDTTSRQLAVFNGTVWSFWKP